MKNAWPWIFGVVAVFMVIGLLFFVRSDRQAYWAARGAIQERVELSQDRIDMAVQMATAAVDVALVQAGNLPSQQAEADLIKQDIEEIGRRMQAAAEARGDAAIEQLSQSIDQYNQTLKTVEEASQKATDPAVKAILDRIYGALEATKEQIAQAVLNAQK